MSAHRPRWQDRFLTRRELLQSAGTGLGAFALADLLEGSAEASGAVSPLHSGNAPHFPAKAKRVVHLFMNGGPAQMDTFDPKPMLSKYHGKPLPAPNLRTERKTGAAMGSPFKFRKFGQSGVEVSELFARTAECIDDICVIRSMVAEVPNHEPSLLLMNCGDGRLPRPSMGSWVTYGLGSENRNLPGFVAMCPGGFPVVGAQNWRSAFLPGAYQGAYIDTQHTDIRKLIEDIKNDRDTPEEQRRQLDLVHSLNQRHLVQRQQDAALEARIESFELAYRMQSEATDAFDFEKEPKSIREMYGAGTQARQLIITRRLLERGVRFVQVWSGAGQPWDNHDNLEAEHRRLSKEWDQPIAAFLKDLKQRGMLDSTLVLWGGEFGRTPVAELPALNGRDHNHYGFSVWLAGGGVKGGQAYGATDDFGFQAVDNPVPVHDLHATMLHLLGIDHKRLTYRYAGRDFRLTDVHGNVIKAVLA